MGLGSGIRDSEKTYSGSRIPDPGVKKAPDPGSGSATLPLRRPQKTNKKKFSAYYFLKLHFHHFSTIKSQKEVTKQ
jgi:hypothetical protein